MRGYGKDSIVVRTADALNNDVRSEADESDEKEGNQASYPSRARSSCRYHRDVGVGIQERNWKWAQLRGAIAAEGWRMPAGASRRNVDQVGAGTI